MFQLQVTYVQESDRPGVRIRSSPGQSYIFLSIVILVCDRALRGGPYTQACTQLAAAH